MLRRFTKNEKGLTLLELLIVLPIAAIVVGAASAVIIQLLSASSTSAHMAALRQVQQAGYWVSTDALQAQVVTANTTTAWGSEDFPLSLKWTDWDSNNHNITYRLMPMGDLYELKRSDGATGITVARYLTANTTCSWNSTSTTAPVLTLTVEASVVAAARGPGAETRTYEIKPRAIV